MKYVVEDESFS